MDNVRSTIQKRDAKGVIRHGAEWLALWSDPDTMRSRDERRALHEAQRHRGVLAEQLAAAARALSGDPHLELQIGDKAGAVGDLLIRSDELADENLPVLRGRLDSRALFLRFHDAATHEAHAPKGADRRLFDLLEGVRCEALGCRLFPGVLDNVLTYHRDRLERADLAGAHLASLIPLAEGLRMVVRDTLLARKDPSIAGSGFWMWDRWLRERLTPELSALAAAQADQARYADAAKALLQATFSALEGRLELGLKRAPSRRRGQAGDDGEGEGRSASGEESQADTAFEPGSDIFVDETPELPPDLMHATPGAEPAPYRAFTTAYDEVVNAADLDDPGRLRTARQMLDQKRSEYRRALTRLVAQLQRRLMALQTRAWTFDLEEGLIDASRLDRVVVNPGFSDAYKREEETLFRDTAVTLLIDNSGSMRGKPIETACVVCDLVSAALEQCDVAVEILGFTTRGWKGGRSALAWTQAHKPANPGRLNDLLHIVYKPFEVPPRGARNTLAAMLSPALLKENIDGEALLWAARRLSARPEARKVLIVVSDGAPVDQATLEANDDKRILDRHLREVIAGLEKGGRIELAAIGLKHDVKAYYRHATRVEKIDDLGSGLVDMLDRLVVRD